MRGRKAERGRLTGAASVVALLVVVGATALSAATSATALDSDRKGFAIFRLEASNGYCVSLTAAHAHAALVPACRHEGEGRFRC